jgi:hypothetical protein
MGKHISTIRWRQVELPGLHSSLTISNIVGFKDPCDCRHGVSGSAIIKSYPRTRTVGSARPTPHTMQALTTTGAMIDGRSNPRAGGAHGATFARPATQAAQLPAEALHTLELPGDAMRRRVQGTTCSVNTSGKGRACKG